MVLLRTLILSLYGRLNLLEFDPNFWTLQNKMSLMNCTIVNGKKKLNNQLKLGSPWMLSWVFWSFVTLN